MTGFESKGRCSLCGGTFSKAGMTRHLEACIKRRMRPNDEKGEASVKLYHIRVEGRDFPEYWMHLLVRADASLMELDHFLRAIWLECCGHLSAFTIHGDRYASDPIEDLDEEDMDATIREVLSPGAEFLHEYDYGSTTELALKVVSEYTGRPSSGEAPVQLLARNEPPPLACGVCGRPATHVCTQCIDLGEGWLCDECAQDHECGEEMLLPVVNSPRVGICGYTGEPVTLV